MDIRLLTSLRLSLLILILLPHATVIVVWLKLKCLGAWRFVIFPKNSTSEKNRGIFSSIAKEYNAALIPFLLEGVAGIPELNLGDGKHPNPQGQKIVTDNVWQIIDSYVQM